MIVRALAATELAACAMFKKLSPVICPEVTFITTDELEKRYPNLTPKQRETEITREYKTVFIARIGDRLPLSGKPHDGRAPDYDDWALNGDIVLWNEVLGCAFEISSMGMRVDPKALDAQLEASGCEERAKLPFHKALLAGELPQTMGGGIGQSRICMLLLGKRHIGEVQSSVWPEETLARCEAEGIHIL